MQWEMVKRNLTDYLTEIYFCGQHIKGACNPLHFP